MENFVLEIKEISKSFGGKRAVNDVNFSVLRGEIVGFLGPNGAGKTTVMNVITGLLSPDKGIVRLFGVDGGASLSKNRNRIGYLQEKPRIYPDMSARDYLHLFARLYDVRNANRRVIDVMERVGISFAADRMLGTFSRGMQQRTCLARVMIHKPDFLILDEPTLGLDPVGVSDLREIFREMRHNGVTLMFSSHQLAEIERICDSVIFMSSGKVVAQGRTADLIPKADDSGVLTVELFEPIHLILPKIKAIPIIEHAVEIDNHRISVVLSAGSAHFERDRRAELVRLLTGIGLTVLSVGTSSYTLEDVFLKLISEGQRSITNKGR